MHPLATVSETAKRGWSSCTGESGRGAHYLEITLPPSGLRSDVGGERAETVLMAEERARPAREAKGEKEKKKSVRETSSSRASRVPILQGKTRKVANQSTRSSQCLGSGVERGGHWISPLRTTACIDRKKGVTESRRVK